VIRYKDIGFSESSRFAPSSSQEQSTIRPMAPAGLTRILPSAGGLEF
jgi:hypothetical protein